MNRKINELIKRRESGYLSTAEITQIDGKIKALERRRGVLMLKVLSLSFIGVISVLSAIL